MELTLSNTYSASLDDVSKDRVGHGFHQVTAKSAYEAAQLVARHIGSTSATHDPEWYGIDDITCRSFVTDAGRHFTLIKRDPYTIPGSKAAPSSDSGMLDIPASELIKASR